MIKDSMYHTLKSLTEIKEVLQDHNSFFGCKRFGMELNAPDGKLPVADTHNLSFVGAGGYQKALREGFGLDEEGVVAGCDQGVGQALEQVLLLVPDRGSLAVHDPVRPSDSGPERLPNALVPEANPEEGLDPSPLCDGGETDAGLVGVAGPRGKDEPVEGSCFDLIQWLEVIAHDLALSTELTEILYQVIGKGIVVVYDEKAHPAWVFIPCSPASCNAP